MWPTDDIWGNALVFAAAGGALILAAFLGSVLGRSEQGRRIMKAASLGVAVLIVLYFAVAMHARFSGAAKECIYAPAHPSDC
jgi:hypothetical protein